jgi:predicted nucleic acid-binding protein
MTHYTLQTRKLNKEITSSQQEALQSLKEVFKSVEDETSLNDAIETAQIDLKQQEETWFAFSNKSRASFLQCLLELASKIDQKSIGLDVEQLTIAEGTITLKAEVRDHDALKTLERELGQSKLLNAFEPQESLQFSMKITLPQANKEASE